MDARSLNHRAIVPDAVITRELDGETILLNLETGVYFGLDKVGTDVWRAILAAGTLEDALDRVQAEYDVEPGVLRTDFVRLVDELLAKGLLQRAE
jgi:coenzyme PQQ synthesis protein D (PqqD)